MKRHDTNPASLTITISSHVEPLAMQQRFNLLFPDFVDHIQLPLPLASTLLERNTFYAKKNRDELDKISCKWCCD